MTTQNVPLPPEWGADELTRFIDQARENQLATFHRKADAYAIISCIDKCFCDVEANISGPITPSIFLMRCHYAYRAACGTSMAGQFAETFPLLRTCLEYSGYGFAMFCDSQLTTTWQNRHKDTETRKASTQKFQIGNIRNLIKQIDPDLERFFHMLYDITIDLGAHPNVMAEKSNRKCTRQKDNTFYYGQIGLHADSQTFDIGLNATARVGVCCLLLFKNVYREKFLFLGIGEVINDLRSKL